MITPKTPKQEIAQLHKSLPASELEVRKATMALQALHNHAEGLQSRAQTLRGNQQLTAEEKARVAELKAELVLSTEKN